MDTSHTTAAPVSPHMQAMTAPALSMKMQPNIGPKASTVMPNGEPPQKRSATLNLRPTVSPNGALPPHHEAEEAEAVAAAATSTTPAASSRTASHPITANTPDNNRLTPVPGRPREPPNAAASNAAAPTPLRRSRRKNAGKRRRTSFSDDIAPSSSSSSSSSKANAKKKGRSAGAVSSNSSPAAPSSTRKRRHSATGASRDPFKQTIATIDAGHSMNVPPLTIDPANEIRRPASATAFNGRKRASRSSRGRANPVPQGEANSVVGARRNSRRSSRAATSGTPSTRAQGKTQGTAKTPAKATRASRRRRKGRAAPMEEEDDDDDDDDDEEEEETDVDTDEEEEETEEDPATSDSENESESELKGIHATFGTIKLKLTHKERFYNTPTEFVNAVCNAFAGRKRFDEVFYQNLYALTSRIPFHPRDFEVVSGDASSRQRPYVPPYPTTAAADTTTKQPPAANVAAQGGRVVQPTPSPPAASSHWSSTQGDGPAPRATSTADRALFHLNGNGTCNQHAKAAQVRQVTAAPTPTTAVAATARTSTAPQPATFSDFTTTAMSRGTDMDFPHATFSRPRSHHCPSCDAKIALPEECMRCAVNACTAADLEQEHWPHDLSRKHPTFRFKNELIARIQHLEKLLKAAKPPTKVDACAQAGVDTREQEQQAALPLAVVSASTQTDMLSPIRGDPRSATGPSRSDDDDGDDGDDGDGDNGGAGGPGAPRSPDQRDDGAGHGGQDGNTGSSSDTGGEVGQHRAGGWNGRARAACAENEDEDSDDTKPGVTGNFEDDTPVRRSRRSRHPSKALLETLWTDDVLKLGKRL